MSRRRALLSWTLLALFAAAIAIGVGLGTAQGAVQGTGPGRGALTLESVLEATVRAHSARFFDDEVMASPGRLDLQSHGTGSIAFATGDGTDVESTRSWQTQSPSGGPTASGFVTQTTAQRTVAGVEYSLSGRASAFNSWSVAGHDRARGVAALMSLLAQTAQVEFSGAGVTGSTRLVAAGQSALGTVPTTVYRLESRAPSGPCASAPPSTAALPTTLLWVDAQGRLRQVRSSWSYTFPVGAFATLGLPTSLLPSGPIVVRATVRLGSFGSPVRVTAPPVVPSHELSTVITFLTKTHWSTTTRRCPGR